MKESAAIVMQDPKRLARSINDSIALGDKSTKEADDRYCDAGRDLAALKKMKPEGVTWEQYLADCGIEISRSRADQLIRFAESRGAIAKERAANAESHAKSRAASPGSPGEPAAEPEASAEAMKAKLAALDDETTSKKPTRRSDLIGAWTKASPEARRAFVRECWTEIARTRDQLDSNGTAQADHETSDRWIEGDSL